MVVNVKKLAELAEEFAYNELSLMGMHTKKLSRSETEERPDFLVTDASESYLIELKSKFPEFEKIEDRNGRLNRGEVVEEKKQLRYENTLSGIVKNAASQLSSYNQEKVDYRLIWLHAQGYWPDMQYSQFEIVLYGKVDIANLETQRVMPCYYYTASEFFYLQNEIDGAILSTSRGGRFCLNTFSKRYPSLKKSLLRGRFRGAVCDPIEEEIQGKAYNISDYDEDRKCESEVLRFLQNKYKQKYLVRCSSYCYGAEAQIGPNN